MSVDVIDAPCRRVTLDELRAHRAEIYAIARRYGVSNVRVFGSVARGEADENSDLDLLIDVAPQARAVLDGRVRCRHEDLLGVFTQVATVPGLKPRIRDRVVAQAVAV